MDERAGLALLASLAAGLSTGIGALPALFVRRLSASVTAGLLGFGGGVMLAASAFSLLGTAFEVHGHRSPWGAVLEIGLAFLSGAAFIYAADRMLPHEHFVKGREGPRGSFVHGAWLFVFAISLHNLPEGLAVGVGFGAPDADLGIAISTGIVIQNLPEGLIVAVSLMAVGYRALFAVAIAAATGLVETLGGVVGFILASSLEFLIGFALAFAAGAMVYVVGQEVIPESHGQGRERAATWGLVVGFILMTAIDQIVV